MQVLKRPNLDTEVIRRVRLNQDYGLIKLREVTIERVRTHLEDTECYTQTVTPAEQKLTLYDVWLGDDHENVYYKIQCGQSGKLWLWFEYYCCYVKKLTFECYAGKSTGWEHLIRRLEHCPSWCSDKCNDFIHFGMMVPWYGEDDPRSGDVAEFLSLAGLDCTATQVKVCGKIIVEE